MQLPLENIACVTRHDEAYCSHCGTVQQMEQTMYEYWTSRTFPGCRKPYEHAGQEFQDAFLREGLRAGSYDDMACWLGHGDL